MSLRDAAQELGELGPRGTLFRIGWELKGRTVRPSSARAPSDIELSSSTFADWTHRLQLEDPIALARTLRPRIPAASLERLRSLGDDAVNGRIECFGRWQADFGQPVDWQRSPVTGGTWDAAAPWSRAAIGDRAGDVKYR